MATAVITMTSMTAMMAMMAMMEKVSVEPKMSADAKKDRSFPSELLVSPALPALPALPWIFTSLPVLAGLVGIVMGFLWSTRSIRS